MKHTREIVRNPNDPDACVWNCEGCDLDRYQDAFPDSRELEAFVKAAKEFRQKAQDFYQSQIRGDIKRATVQVMFDAAARFDKAVGAN